MPVTVLLPRPPQLIIAPHGIELDPVDEAPSPELLCCPDSSKVTEARVLDELLPAAPLFFLSMEACANETPTLPPPFLGILGAGGTSGLTASFHDQTSGLQSFTIHFAALG